MRRSITRVSSVVFFCLTGWVYSSSANGADVTVGTPDAAAAVTPAPDAAAATVTPPATQPSAGLFESKAPAGKSPEKLPDGQTVAVGSFGQIDLHVKDLELTQVLQLLSIQSQRNIVAAKSVAGAISADLYGVDFYEALDAILHTNGFGYREKGNFIYVYTDAEMKTIADAERKVVHRVVRLNYITATDAAKFLQPLLSTAGSLAVNGDPSAGFQPSLADGGANSNARGDLIIIRDFPENIEEILAILKELDVRPKQVLVEASILQARLSEDNAFGVDLTILADFAMNEFTSPLAAIDNLLGGTGPTGAGANGGAGSTSVGQTAAGQSGMRVGIISKNIAAFIKALDQVTDTTVLANPKVLVLNRQKTELLVGEKLGYLSTTTTDTSATQTVQFLDVGTKLTLRPFVSDDNFIRMELKPSISEGATKQVGTTVIPNETTQEMTSNVMVRTGQTIVLGGLFKEDTTISRRQVPYLGDVPLVGLAFKGQDDTVARAEIIFLVTPTVLKDEALYAAGDRVRDGVEAARLGAREGLLPWSRSKLTAGHLRDAMKYQKEGQREKAVLSTNMALSLDPSLPEAMRLREELTGQRLYWPDNSIMEESINRVIKQQLDTTPAAPPAKSQSPAPEAHGAAAASGTQTQTGTAPRTAAATAQTAAPAAAAQASPSAQAQESPAQATETTAAVDADAVRDDAAQPADTNQGE